MNLSKTFIGSLLAYSLLLSGAGLSADNFSDTDSDTSPETSEQSKESKILLGSRYNPFPQTINFFDLEKYLGTWYQIASTNPKFSKNCTNSKAEYALDDDTITVKNSCNLFEPCGELSVAEGVVEPTTRFGPAVFKVTFDTTPTNSEDGTQSFQERLTQYVSGALTSVLGWLPNYWIVEADKDFQSYAVVTSAGKNPIFILSREKEMDPLLYNSILQGLYKRGFNISKIEKTIQSKIVNQ